MFTQLTSLMHKPELYEKGTARFWEGSNPFMRMRNRGTFALSIS